MAMALKQILTECTWILIESLCGWIVESRKLIILKEDDVASACKFLLRRDAILSSCQHTDLVWIEQLYIGVLRDLSQTMVDDEGHCCL
jgi:hypothetical protein